MEIPFPNPQWHIGDFLMHVLSFSWEFHMQSVRHSQKHQVWHHHELVLPLAGTFPYAQLQRKPRKLLDLHLNFIGFSSASFILPTFPVGSTTGFLSSWQHIWNRLLFSGKDFIAVWILVYHFIIKGNFKKSVPNHCTASSGIWPTVVRVLWNQVFF